MIATQHQEARIAVPVKARAPRKNVSIYLGLLLVVGGIVLSVSTLEWTIFPEGTIPSGSRRALALASFRALLVCLGAVLLWKRPLITVIHLTAGIVMGGIATVLGSIAAQV